MTQIRVGQVFKYDKDETSRIVITLKSLSGVTIICNDGSAGSEIKDKTPPQTHKNTPC